jgi:hypothetical protein
MNPTETSTVSPIGPASSGRRPFRVHEVVSGRFRIVREIAAGGMGIV